MVASKIAVSGLSLLALLSLPVRLKNPPAGQLATFALRSTSMYQHFGA